MAFKAFIKPFEAPRRSVKIKIVKDYLNSEDYLKFFFVPLLLMYG